MMPAWSIAQPEVPWTERHAGTIVSISVFTALFAWSISTGLAMPAPMPEETVLEVEIAPPEDPPAPDLVPEKVPAEVRFDEGAALVAASSAEVPIPLKEWRPTTPEEVAAVSQATDDLQDLRRELEKQRDELQAKIHLEETAAAGRDFKLSSDGAANGVVRTLDTRGFSDDIVRPLLARYGITIEVRHASPSADKRVFLSAASTGGGTYTNISAEGVYDVFVMSTKAVSMLATMETQALMSKGAEPGRSRITKITFGILKDPQTGDFMLGVTDLEFDRLQ